MTGLFGATTVVMNLRNAANEVLQVELCGPQSMDFALGYYGGELYAKDPRSPYLENTPLGAIYYDYLLWDVEQMERHEGVRASTDLIGVTHQLGVRLALPGSMYGAVAILTSDAQGHATDPAIRSFQRLAPHLEQAMSLGLLMEREAATRSALLDALAGKADGLILLGPNGAPFYMNDAAAGMLNGADGLTYRRGAFVTHRLPETRRMNGLVGVALSSARRRAATPAVGRMLVSRPSGRHPYVVSVISPPPTERFLAGQAISAVIHLQDLAAVRLPSHEALRMVFGLTDREAALAIELVRCADLERAAVNAAMAVNTARNHLQSIFRKISARGQAEAVQLLGRLP